MLQMVHFLTNLDGSNVFFGVFALGLRAAAALVDGVPLFSTIAGLDRREINDDFLTIVPTFG